MSTILKWLPSQFACKKKRYSTPGKDWHDHERNYKERRGGETRITPSPLTNRNCTARFWVCIHTPRNELVKHWIARLIFTLSMQLTHHACSPPNTISDTRTTWYLFTCVQSMWAYQQRCIEWKNMSKSWNNAPSKHKSVPAPVYNLWPIAKFRLTILPMMEWITLESIVHVCTALARWFRFYGQVHTVLRIHSAISVQMC